ncbi:hypothetical protein CTI12_AA071200 [Artemisia annua]|uniref:Uncharacterized protein n=1 Tax=Artemisia annua TaxID=35608 RepID=A0A2U1Q4Q9_ARTAN|nr:hypothetical protein CTI12_AA071200 [Artemisia annua]
MVNLKEIMANKTVIGLVLGQILSLLITSTGFSSSELARRGFWTLTEINNRRNCEKCRKIDR